ncbi:MAG: formylglycine-generating enzyme family protein, partial [Anaerolineales bacterium]|nr:formylglycine-generating enzyme family protein [Anaerolineales bacterium]
MNEIAYPFNRILSCVCKHGHLDDLAEKTEGQESPHRHFRRASRYAGNVKEWIQDIYQNNYLGVPTDGTAWETGDNSFRVVLGCSVGDDSAGRC